MFEEEKILLINVSFGTQKIVDNMGTLKFAEKHFYVSICGLKLIHDFYHTLKS